MTQRINEQIGALPAIESEFHLFKISGEMLGANPMPRPHDSALEKRKGRFNGIGVNVSHDVYARTVIDFLVVRSFGFPHGRIIRGRIVGENDFHVLGDILADVLCERSTLCVSGVEEAQVAIALADANNYFLVVILCDMALAAIYTADISNVHLDLAIQHRLIGLCHCVPNAMAEIPSRLIAHSDRALNLAGRHTLLRFAEQVSSQKPLLKRQVRIVEYGAGSDGELIVTVFAVEELLVGFQLDHRPFAAQAFWDIRPAEMDEQGAALISGWEKRVYIK